MVFSIKHKPFPETSIWSFCVVHLWGRQTKQIQLQTRLKSNYLVGGFLPLGKIWVRQLGWWNSQYMGKLMATKPPTSYALLIHFKTLNKPTKNRRPSRRASKSRCQVDQLSHDMLLFCFGPKKAREKRRFHAEFYMKSGCHRDKPWGSNKKYLESGAPIFFGWSCERSDFFLKVFHHYTHATCQTNYSKT